MTALAIASWLLTYVIHSTVLLGAAWLISRHLGDRHLQLQETLLRFALIGGLLTTTLQLGLGVKPLAGAFSFQSSSSPHVSAGLAEVTDGPVFVDTAAQISPGADNTWAIALLATWCLGSLVALLVLARSIFDLRRLLHTRRFRPAGRVIERLAAAMGLRREVRLSTSKAIAIPFATGIRKPEICCPERVCELAAEHQTGLFAHELAHIARRDPAWQLFYRIGEAILCLQPLNRLVRSRLEEIAEHLTDERAVSCTGNRLGLARCLVVLAHWGTSSRLGVPAAAFAAGPRLDRRVSRLLEGRMDAMKSTRWMTPILVCLLGGAVLILPAVASVSADSTATIQKKTWSTAEDAPTDAPATPAQPAPPEPLSPDSPPAAPDPETVPAPAVIPSPEWAPQPAAAPKPAALPSGEAAPAPLDEPAPVAQPAQPAPPSPAAPRTPADEDREIRARERAQREVEARERAEKRARCRAEEAEREAVRQAERARRRAEETAHRAQLTEERQREIRERAVQMQKEAESRAQERALRTYQARLADLERTEARVQRRQERAQAQAREAGERAAEARARAEDRAIAMEEQARAIAERARILAEEAERQGLEERSQKED